MPDIERCEGIAGYQKPPATAFETIPWSRAQSGGTVNGDGLDMEESRPRTRTLEVRHERPAMSYCRLSSRDQGSGCGLGEDQPRHQAVPDPTVVLDELDRGVPDLHTHA
jgi:hypothetical protein